MVRRPEDLTPVCEEMGWPGLRALQLDPGNDLFVETNFVLNYQYGMISFRPNKRVFLTGPRNTDYQTFCVVDKPYKNRNVFDFGDHGSYFEHGTLIGMLSSKSEESFQIGPSGSLQIAAVPWELVNDWCDKVSKLGDQVASDFRKVMGKYNEYMLDPVWYDRLCAAFRRRAYSPQPDPDGEDFDQLMCIIAQTVTTGVVDSGMKSMPESASLTKKIVDVAYSSDGCRPLKLSCLATLLHSDQRTLQHDTNRQLGVGPMDLLRLCRFHQARRVLTYRPANEEFEAIIKTRPTVERVFKHFGLSYSPHTRGLYQEFFGKTPKQDELDSLKTYAHT